MSNDFFSMRFLKTLHDISKTPAKCHQASAKRHQASSKRHQCFIKDQKSVLSKQIQKKTKKNPILSRK